MLSTARLSFCCSFPIVPSGEFVPDEKGLAAHLCLHSWMVPLILLVVLCQLSIQVLVVTSIGPWTPIRWIALRMPIHYMCCVWKHPRELEDDSMGFFWHCYGTMQMMLTIPVLNLEAYSQQRQIILENNSIKYLSTFNWFFFILYSVNYSWKLSHATKTNIF